MKKYLYYGNDGLSYMLHRNYYLSGSYQKIVHNEYGILWKVILVVNIRMVFGMGV